MTEPLRVRDLVIVGATLTAGVLGAVVALGSRGADAQFLQNQQHPPNLGPAEVARVVRSAPDPKTGTGSGKSAACARLGRGPLGNPWSCVVTFPSGRRVRLRVRVNEDGTYSGRYAGGGGATGCCIDLPGAQ